MGRLSRLAERLERVLALSERVLRDLAGSDPGPELFEGARAFRWEDARGPGRLVAISEPARFDLSDLVGVDAQVERFVRNVEQFASGLPFNHVLLYGERGTGKSSAVKGVLERFAPRGLRLVELHKSQLPSLPRVLEAVRGAGAQRFLLFCDDLSFDLGEAGYRELKAALEGSLEAPPPNVCIVATSNRRHLLPETMSENREALEEKLALSDRFGLVLGFYSFDQKTYLAIVEHYAKRAALVQPWEEIREEALRWALARASRSGRTARQFVDDLAGRSALRRHEEAQHAGKGVR
jgi:predicted AAA+ superfamily ATPase